MESDAFIRMFAGTVILASALLTWLVSPWWLLLTAFAALNLLQSAFTGFCPPTRFLGKMGWLHRDGRIRWGREVRRR